MTKITFIIILEGVDKIVMSLWAEIFILFA